MNFRNLYCTLPVIPAHTDVTGEYLKIFVPETSSLLVREIILYPNPGSTHIYIQTGKNDKGIQFFNSQGRLFYQADIHAPGHIVNTHSWPSGMYLYQIRAGQELIDTGKWIKTQ